MLSAVSPDFFWLKSKIKLAKELYFPYKTSGRAEVAQLVEQGTENPRVGSSILSLGTTNFKDLRGS